MTVLLSSDMKNDGSAINRSLSPLSIPSGVAFGALGVLAFSLTVPLTRVAVADLDPLLVGVGRAVIAGLLAVGLLAVARPRLPRARQWMRLAVVAGGVVLGFPVFTSLALTTTTAAHAAVVVGLLPAATAVAAVLRTGERPQRRFWVFAVLGALAVAVFSTLGHGSLGPPRVGDLLLLAAVVAGAVGYAEGGLLARELGAWQTISWALVVALPATAATTAVMATRVPPHAGLSAWAAFAYLSAVSMFLGFFAWYRGLAIGPMTTVSQIQLTQPVLSVLWSVALLGEHLTATVIAGAVAIIACATCAVRSRPATGSRSPVVPHRTSVPARSTRPRVSH
jgi:drug/metabolite transporter (DMT)-like permease